MSSSQEPSMSLNNVPCKAEVMGWSPQSLADYMRRLKLTGCNKVVIKGSITGAQFMQMTEGDLQAFPSLYVPIITKIQSDMKKGEQKRAFGHKSKAQKHPKPVFVQEEETWNSDEFDNDSDCEGPCQEERENSYTDSLTDPQTAEQHDSDETSEEDYEVPSSEATVEPPQNPRVVKRPDIHFKDSVPSPAERPAKPPPKITYAPLRPFKHRDGQPNLPVDRSKKPGRPGQSQKDFIKSKGSADKSCASFTSKILPAKASKPTDVSNRTNKVIPAPPVPTQPAMADNSISGPTEGMDPSWYRGKMTRHEAEAALREVNEDGAFLVRDSSLGSVEHPYTLMLLKQKVYNIKIRTTGNSYSLGTGHKNTKSFPGVKEMITHHTHTPLLLIDATDQSSETQSQCCLLHPVGL